MEKIKADVFILGAGAGGTGLAYFLASNGIKTAVCDQNPYFGGTSVYSGVNCWEPGVSFDGLHLVLKDYLLKSGGGFVCKSYPNGSFLNPELKNDWSSNDFSKYCWGYSDFDPDGRYEDTLKRCKMFFAASGVYKRFQFDDTAMTNALRAVFAPLNNNLIPLFGRSFADVKHKDGAVRSVIMSDGTEVEAKVFADCTGNIILARCAGCDHTIGSEGIEDYGEPSAGRRSDSINGVTYVFRVSKTDDPSYVDPLPPDIPEVGFNKNTVSCFNVYPGGDVNINMLPTMDGNRYFGGEHENCIAIVRRYWNYLQLEKGLSGFRLKKIFAPGIRESYRLKGRYILTENDLITGVFRQNNSGHFAAVVDHMRDIHGSGGLSKELETPFGIPLETLETKEFDNLFVCSRGASFSHIAASSARLTRTLISAGEGLGSFVAADFFGKSNDDLLISRKLTINKWRNIYE